MVLRDGCLDDSLAGAECDLDLIAMGCRGVQNCLLIQPKFVGDTIRYGVGEPLWHGRYYYSGLKFIGC
jgi:hypothetical protein